MEYTKFQTDFFRPPKSGRKSMYSSQPSIVATTLLMLPLHRRLYHHFPQWQVTPQTIYWSSNQNEVILRLKKQLHFRTLKFSSPLLGRLWVARVIVTPFNLFFLLFHPSPLIVASLEMRITILRILIIMSRVVVTILSGVDIA